MIISLPSVQETFIASETYHRLCHLENIVSCMFVWLVADVWCWFVLRENYCWLVVGGWFVLREKYCWLVADKLNEQGV
jgi:hypothetical protein